MEFRPRRRAPAGLLAAAAAFAFTTPVRAEYIIDLTTYGATSTYQGAVFQQSSMQPTGTGVFDPFVRIQESGPRKDGYERGYNTDGKEEFDSKETGGHNWNHSLRLDSLAATTIDGVDYYAFKLDINEKGTAEGAKLSLNEFQLFLGNAPDLTGFQENTGFGSASRLVYDLDASGDARIELFYRLESGSGSGDMIAYVPTAAFAGFAGAFQYVYLYSAFGRPNVADAGFEEWAAQTGGGGTTNNPVPAPPAVVLTLVGVMGCMLTRRTRAKLENAA